VKLIQEIGSYAGLAAVLGLAVLSALYFSQARDVRRLREWAGRAPERDAEARSRVGAANNMRQTPAAQAQVGRPAVAGGNSTGAAAPAPARAAPVAASAAGAGAAAVGGGRSGVASPARPGQRVSAQTSILAAQDEPRERWYRRIAPRYVVLIVAGVLVLGGGGAVGVMQLMKKDSNPGAGTPQADTPAGDKTPATPKPSQPLRPADVSVAVFNATGTAGLASQYGDQAQAAGFTKDNVGNFRPGQRAESVVLYAPGHQREAKLVRREFNINQIEQADPTVLADAPQADVILVIGADKTGG
jgi:hypothetical protein